MNFLNILMMPVQIYIYYLPPCGDDHSIRESSWFYTVGTGRRLPPHPHHPCQTTTTRWSKTGDELMLWITDSFSLLLFRDYYSTCNDMTSILLIHPVSCWWSAPQFVAMTFRIHSPSVVIQSCDLSAYTRCLRSSTWSSVLSTDRHPTTCFLARPLTMNSSRLLNGRAG